MKKEFPTLEEVKEYFKNAKEVRCLYKRNITDITKNISKSIFICPEDKDNDFWIRISTHKGMDVLLWSKERGFAEIISFKENKPKFEHLEEIEVTDNELYYDEKGLFIGYSKDGDIVVEYQEGYFCKWKYARKIDLKKIETIKCIKRLMLENNIKIEELKQK